MKFLWRSLLDPVDPNSGWWLRSFTIPFPGAERRQQKKLEIANCAATSSVQTLIDAKEIRV